MQVMPSSRGKRESFGAAKYGGVEHRTPVINFMQSEVRTAMEGIFGKIGKISLMRIAVISVLAVLATFAVSGMGEAAVVNTTGLNAGTDATPFSGLVEGFWTFSAIAGAWNYDTLTTTSSSVGPCMPYEGASYGFTEASSSAGPDFIAISPVLDLTNNIYTIDFWYDKHHNGTATCLLAVELSTDGGSTWPTTLFTTVADDGATPTGGACTTATWHNQVIDLTAYSGTNAKVRIRANSGGAFQCDTGLDLIVTSSTTRCSDPDPATLTTTAPTSGSTVSGTYKVQTQVGVEGTPSGMTGMVVNIANAGACNVSNGSMTWNAGSSRWEYDWNTSACGTVTPVTGVTVNVSGTDPDCPTTVSAAAVTNVTISNTQAPSTITSCAGCHQYSPTFGDGTARNVPAGQFPGSHNGHVQGAGYACSVCHIAPATTTSADFAHRSGTIQMLSGATAIGGGYYDKNNNSAYNAGVDNVFSVSNSPTMGSCRSVSCHATGLPGATVPTPTWGGGPANCTWCHGDPPTTSTLYNHSGVSAGVCDSCHPHNGSGPQHADGTLQAVASCTGCHNVAQGSRDAVVSEFGLAWGHKKSGRGAVTDADCIVCHLEGLSSGGFSSYHADGNIDLRDPDGAGETPITNNSGGAFTFTKFSISYAAGSRTSAISNSVADVITQKFCLACHDSNGATNPTARTSGGTAAMPFGGIALGSGYVAAANAIGTQGLVDVKTQFATSNSSVHPVMGPRNKDFPAATRVAAPYTPTGTRGTSGTKSDSMVMNCFDCHNVSGASPLTTRTNVAHGNAETIRGTIYVNSPTLCLICHIGGYNSGNVHGTGSAWQSTGSSHSSTIPACQRCHGGNTAATTAPARPRPAQDYHGSNALYGGGLWPTVNSRPYAFIRSWSGTAYHRPFRSSEFTSGSATCANGTCNNGDRVGDGSTRTYTPGGSY